ncbi:hypothetical protein HDA32_002201 [Spinactinospora alkalitolerans]|uniref:Uncharacterized protein n=1 Tax=Spinactinospora alkalitolerans TaxID=687207 RepID=A0A852TTU7_9ACTN|nr:hypothetical protein [Spinactinospora alkalitolerans]
MSAYRQPWSAWLVEAAGRRWSAEENLQTAGPLTGLGRHQARHWRSWHRWTLPAMLAHALLTVLAIGRRTSRTTPHGLAAVTEVLRCLPLRRTVQTNRR